MGVGGESNNGSKKKQKVLWGMREGWCVKDEDRNGVLRRGEWKDTTKCWELKESESRSLVTEIVHTGATNEQKGSYHFQNMTSVNLDGSVEMKCIRK